MSGAGISAGVPVSVLYEPEFLRDDKSVIDDREGRITKSLTHLGRVPELLMAGPPLRDRGKSFPFPQRVVEVHIGQPYHPHRGRLDNRDAAAGRVDHNLAQPGSWQRVVLVLVAGGQPGCRGLLTRHDRGDELITQRPGEGELRDWQIIGRHGRKPTDPESLVIRQMPALPAGRPPTTLP